MSVSAELHARGLARATVLAGPSGVGKGTIARLIAERHPNVFLSVSATTRPPRIGEVDGEDYLFVDREWFNNAIADDAILESATYQGNLYGTPRAGVENALFKGRPALLEIDLQGARQVRKSLPQALQVFVKPPSFSELSRRLRERGTEDPETCRKRLARAKEELAAADEFDVIIVNDELEQAVRELEVVMGLSDAERR